MIKPRHGLVYVLEQRRDANFPSTDHSILGVIISGGVGGYDDGDKVYIDTRKAFEYKPGAWLVNYKDILGKETE